MSFLVPVVEQSVFAALWEVTSVVYECLHFLINLLSSNMLYTCNSRLTWYSYMIAMTSFKKKINV